MITCKNCGVELNDNTNYCPLCGTPVIGDDNKKKSEGYDNLEEFKKLSRFERFKILWEIISFVLLSELVITTVIDVIITHTITWSKYSISISILFFLNFSIFIFIEKKIFLKYLLSFLSMVSFIFILAIFEKKLGHTLNLTIPLIFTGYIIFFTFNLVMIKSKKEIFKLIGLLLITIGLLSIIIELIISAYINNSLTLSWSLIASVSLFFIALLMFYFNYRLKKISDLKRFFHL